MPGGLAPSTHPGTCPFLYALDSLSPSHFGWGHEVAAPKTGASQLALCEATVRGRCIAGGGARGPGAVHGAELGRFFQRFMLLWNLEAMVL